MTAELTTAGGVAEMAYVGEVPWHGLGNKLEPGAPIETWREAAGMNWTVVKAGVRYFTGRDDNGSPIGLTLFPNKRALFRSDNHGALGIVSNKFQIVQPGEVLEFFRDLTEAAGFQLETAGTLFGGSRFWALAKIGAEAKIRDPRDKVKAHLLLSTACDGSMATTASYVNTRVVCNNTLQLARREGAPRVRVSHKSAFDPEQVKRDLGIERAMTQFESIIADMRRLADAAMPAEIMAAKTVELLSPDYDSLDGKARKRLLSSRPMTEIGRRAIDRTAIGSNMAGAGGTAWGWLNAVTEFVDHVGNRETTSADNRIDSAWFGKGSDLKDRAFDMALAYADTGEPQERGSGMTAQQWLDRFSG